MTTKKDYQAIARAIYRAQAEPYPAGVDSSVTPLGVAILLIADVLQAENPRFDRGRFVKACETGRWQGDAQMSREYNGHHCWNCWNVALWIGGDEGLYSFARECIQQHASNNQAATRFLACVEGRTPDGARYTRTAVRAALAGLRE